MMFGLLGIAFGAGGETAAVAVVSAAMACPMSGRVVLLLRMRRSLRRLGPWRPRPGGSSWAGLTRRRPRCTAGRSRSTSSRSGRRTSGSRTRGRTLCLWLSNRGQSLELQKNDKFEIFECRTGRLTILVQRVSPVKGNDLTQIRRNGGRL